MENTGAALRRLRGNRDPKEFAAELGISELSLRAYESGSRIPRDEVKARIRALARKQMGEKP